MENAAQKSDRGWRGSADLWLQAAYDVLIDQGVDAVKVGVLAQRLGLSRTSFYWHYRDREALLAALIARWQGQNTGNLIAQTNRYAATISEAMLNVIDCWVTPSLFDSRLEFGIRNWAQGAPDLASVLAGEDAARLAAFVAMYHRFGFAPAEADTRARAMYLTQIGYIALRSAETWPERLARVPFYVQVFTGQSPSADEMTRFAARYASGNEVAPLL